MNKFFGYSGNGCSLYDDGKHHHDIGNSKNCILDWTGRQGKRQGDGNATSQTAPNENLKCPFGKWRPAGQEGNGQSGGNGAGGEDDNDGNESGKNEARIEGNHDNFQPDQQEE